MSNGQYIIYVSRYLHNNIHLYVHVMLHVFFGQNQQGGDAAATGPPASCYDMSSFGYKKAFIIVL